MVLLIIMNQKAAGPDALGVYASQIAELAWNNCQDHLGIMPLQQCMDLRGAL